MIHDLQKPYGDPEDRFNSPYFEIMFVYMFYCAILYVINFTGYDGFFGLSINHACLKMELYCKAFEDALRAKSYEEMHAKIVGVIREQNRLFKYVELIQETFNIWLGIILIATMIQICNCMYHITESLETATLIYCANWERVSIMSIRKMVLFMIARAQIPLEITAFNKLIFDMDLFVSILQTSYSMYTLLRS
ncbi:odorant receptor 13a-like [Colias croceus]|uniref:odorant receptor 13a-like n=1 Tax=Colias crocea TaxID=72248 RepID=UPI001E27B73A|nr:odorant receptor 13a-like [Colias croceus]